MWGERHPPSTQTVTHTQRERERDTHAVCVSVKGHFPEGIHKGQSGRVSKDIVQKALSKSQRALSKDSVGSARAR